MAKALVPELYVSNLETSLVFYIEVLGFEVAYDRPDETFAYLHREGAELMLEQVGEKSWLTGELAHPFGRGVNFQIQVAEIAPLYEACLHTAATIKVPLERREYDTGDQTITQTQFVVQDPDGYLIRLAEIEI
ncbi:MAG: VOC family protein [Pseudomonadota bacterium]